MSCDKAVMSIAFKSKCKGKTEVGDKLLSFGLHYGFLICCVLASVLILVGEKL